MSFVLTDPQGLLLISRAGGNLPVLKNDVINDQDHHQTVLELFSLLHTFCFNNTSQLLFLGPESCCALCLCVLVLFLKCLVYLHPFLAQKLKLTGRSPLESMHTHGCCEYCSLIFPNI